MPPFLISLVPFALKREEATSYGGTFEALPGKGKGKGSLSTQTRSLREALAINLYRRGHGWQGRGEEQPSREGEDAGEDDVGRQVMETEMVKTFEDMGGGAEDEGKEKQRKSFGAGGPRV